MSQFEIEETRLKEFGGLLPYYIYNVLTVVCGAR